MTGFCGICDEPSSSTSGMCRMAEQPSITEGLVSGGGCLV
jgi:hypothetical protein